MNKLASSSLLSSTMKKSFIIHPILSSLLVWRIALFIVAFGASIVIVHFNNSFPYVDKELIPTGLPDWIWGFGNFDGVHYIRIAQMGYAANQYTQAFFPLYPALMYLLSFLGGYFGAGLLISNLSLIAALYFLYKLFALDEKRDIASKSLVLLLVFPTAYYFGSVYSESLFLLLSVLSVYFLRREKYLLSGIFIFLASLTRVVGVFLVFLFLIEVYQQLKSKQIKLNDKKSITAVIGLVIGGLGIVAYMVYLKINFNNPFYFITAQSVFGAQRSESITLLPQVFFRYIKIFQTVSIHSYAFFTAAVEFLFSLAGLVVLVFSVTKIRLSYWVFSAACYLLPTLTGTLSSMPRYVLMEFLLLPFLVKALGKFYLPTVVLFGALEIVLLSLFIRGYWIA